MIDKAEKSKLLLLQKALDNAHIDAITNTPKGCGLVNNQTLPDEDHRYQAKYWTKELRSGREIGSDIIVIRVVRDSLWSELVVS